MALEFFMDSAAVCSSDKNAKVICDKKNLLHLIFDNFSISCQNVVEQMVLKILMQGAQPIYPNLGENWLEWLCLKDSQDLFYL